MRSIMGDVVVVIDASSMVHAMQSDDDEARFIRRSIAGATIAVPPHFHIECASVIRGITLGKKVKPQVARGMLAELADLPLRTIVFDEIEELMFNNLDNISAYDNAYVAVAQLLGAPLITRDAGLRKASAKLIATIP